MPSSLRLLTTTIAFTLVLLCETHAVTTLVTSTKACETRCSVRAKLCRETKRGLLGDCTLTATCDQPACKRDYKCSYGCAVCKNQLKYQLAECDAQLDACATECGVTQEV